MIKMYAVDNEIERLIEFLIDDGLIESESRSLVEKRVRDAFDEVLSTFGA